MNQERVVKAGLLGLGTVGSGVYKLVERQKNEMALKAGAGLEIQKILVHNINKKREGVDQSLLTDKWEDIMNDDEIEIVIEVMGGIEPARTMILEALHAGKNVVTANMDTNFWRRQKKVEWISYLRQLWQEQSRLSVR